MPHQGACASAWRPARQIHCRQPVSDIPTTGKVSSTRQPCSILCTRAVSEEVRNCTLLLSPLLVVSTGLVRDGIEHLARIYVLFGFLDVPIAAVVDAEFLGHGVQQRHHLGHLMLG